MQTTSLSSRRLHLASEFARSIPGRILIVLGATIVVALAAHVAIPLWFTPVPLTLQPLAVLGIGLALGPVDAFCALLVYLLEGASGLPVFSPTGPGGLAQLLGPTGGFLMAYPAVAFITSALTRALQRRIAPFVAALLACTCATLLLFVEGATWLTHLTHISTQAAMTAAVLPFLPGEAVKILVAAGIYSAMQRRAAQ